MSLNHTNSGFQELLNSTISNSLAPTSNPAAPSNENSNAFTIASIIAGVITTLVIVGAIAKGAMDYRNHLAVRNDIRNNVNMTNIINAISSNTENNNPHQRNQATLSLQAIIGTNLEEESPRANTSATSTAPVLESQRSRLV